MPCVCLRTVGSQPKVKYQLLCFGLLGVAANMFEATFHLSTTSTATFGAFATDAIKVRGLKGGGMDYKWDGGSNAGSHFLFRQLLDVYVARKSERCFPRFECDRQSIGRQISILPAYHTATKGFEKSLKL